VAQLPVAQVVSQIGHLGQQQAGAMHQNIAVVCQAHATAMTLEYSDTQQRFYFAEPLANGRGAHAELFPGGTHATQIGQNSKQFELPHSQRGDHSIS